MPRTEEIDELADELEYKRHMLALLARNISHPITAWAHEVRACQRDIDRLEGKIRARPQGVLGRAA
jgi:hypothetical protein